MQTISKTRQSGDPASSPGGPISTLRTIALVLLLLLLLALTGCATSSRSAKKKGTVIAYKPGLITVQGKKDTVYYIVESFARPRPLRPGTRVWFNYDSVKTKVIDGRLYYYIKH